LGESLGYHGNVLFENPLLPHHLARGATGQAHPGLKDKKGWLGPLGMAWKEDDVPSGKLTGRAVCKLVLKLHLFASASVASATF